AMNTDQTHLTVTRTVDVPAKEVFDLLTLPARHHEFDGSGTVRSADDTERIDKVGEQFVMNMHRDAMGGDYRTHNFVTAYDENKMIGWQPAPEGEDGTAPTEPLGWEWLYELKPLGAPRPGTARLPPVLPAWAAHLGACRAASPPAGARPAARSLPGSSQAATRPPQPDPEEHCHGRRARPPTRQPDPGRDRAQRPD